MTDRPAGQDGDHLDGGDPVPLVVVRVGVALGAVRAIVGGKLCESGTSRRAKKKLVAPPVGYTRSA